MSLSEKTKKWLSKNADVSLAGKAAIATGAEELVAFTE